MPAARGRAAKERLPGGDLIEVERLRIELAGEGLDLICIDCMRPADKALSHLQIVEVKDVGIGAAHGSMLLEMRGVLGP